MVIVSKYLIVHRHSNLRTQSQNGHLGLKMGFFVELCGQGNFVEVPNFTLFSAFQHIFSGPERIPPARSMIFCKIVICLFCLSIFTAFWCIFHGQVCSFHRPICKDFSIPPSYFSYGCSTCPRGPSQHLGSRSPLGVLGHRCAGDTPLHRPPNSGRFCFPWSGTRPC